MNCDLRAVDDLRSGMEGLADGGGLFRGSIHRIVSM